MNERSEIGALPTDSCNCRGFEAVTLRIRKEAAGNPDPCPWCENVRLRRELKEAQQRSFVQGRISYRGFSYGVGSQWGIDSLRRAIEEDNRG